MVTAPGSGAEVIPFLKTWVNLPMAIGFTVLYAKVTHPRLHPCLVAIIACLQAAEDLYNAAAIVEVSVPPACSWPTCCPRRRCSTLASCPSLHSLAPSPSSCTLCATCCTPQVWLLSGYAWLPFIYLACSNECPKKYSTPQHNTGCHSTTQHSNSAGLACIAWMEQAKCRCCSGATLMCELLWQPLRRGCWTLTACVLRAPFPSCATGPSACST